MNGAGKIHERFMNKKSRRSGFMNGSWTRAVYNFLDYSAYKFMNKYIMNSQGPGPGPWAPASAQWWDRSSSAPWIMNSSKLSKSGLNGQCWAATPADLNYLDFWPKHFMNNSWTNHERIMNGDITTIACDCWWKHLDNAGLQQLLIETKWISDQSTS